MPPKATIIFPLYIYPDPDVWQPLYDAISENPTLQFLIIINPHNGPGEDALPDENYRREVAQLNSYENVVIIGYVRVDYCKRPLQEVLDDVTKYGEWAADYDETKLGVRGIFVDESPNLFTQERLDYLNALDQHIKNTDGILGDRIVTHNPGTVPDVEYTNPGPDITTIVEESLAEWRSDPVQSRTSELLKYPRDRCAYMVHSMPFDVMWNTVMDLRERGQYIFVTDNFEEFYCKFGERWKDFVWMMAQD